MNERIITPITFKSFAKDVTVNSEGRIVAGYFAAFNNKDSDGDIILKGAFSKSIQEHGPESQSARKIAFLWQHDSKEPLGRITTLKEDEYGLYFEASIDRTIRGEQAIEQYKSGTLNQHSIGFRYIADKTRYDEEKEAFIIGEVILYEGSVVTMGANENTPFIGMKEADLQSENEKILQETEQICKALMPSEAQQIRSLFSKWFALAQAQPGKPTTPIEPPTVDKVADLKAINDYLLKHLTK